LPRRFVINTRAASLYRPLFERISPYLAENAEITSEANPNSATCEWLEGMYTLGVNRISFGVQSFDDAKLHTLARAHNTAQALDAVWQAAKIGYQHLSIDLIYGVAGDTQKLLEHDLATAFSLPIDHISLYALTIEEATPFEKTPEMAREELELTRWLFERIREKGFTQYEISNFGTYRSRHNLGYWEHKPYIGLGSGAVGFLGNRRFYPLQSPEAYIQNPNEIHTETLSSADLLGEKLFLGFRSCVGVAHDLLSAKQQKTADQLCESGLLEYRDGRYFNPDYLLADEIALRVEGF